MRKLVKLQVNNQLSQKIRQIGQNNKVGIYIYTNHQKVSM